MTLTLSPSRNRLIIGDVELVTTCGGVALSVVTRRFGDMGQEFSDRALAALTVDDALTLSDALASAARRGIGGGAVHAQEGGHPRFATRADIRSSQVCNSG